MSNRVVRVISPDRDISKGTSKTYIVNRSRSRERNEPPPV